MKKRLRLYLRRRGAVVESHSQRVRADEEAIETPKDLSGLLNHNEGQRVRADEEAIETFVHFVENEDLMLAWSKSPR